MPIAGRSGPGRIVALVPYLDIEFLGRHNYFIRLKKLIGHTGLEHVACLDLCCLSMLSKIQYQRNLYTQQIFLRNQYFVFVLLDDQKFYFQLIPNVILLIERNRIMRVINARLVHDTFEPKLVPTQQISVFN